MHQSNSTFLHRLQQSTFFVKLFNWEYWPMSIANLPVVLIYLWFALRARRLFFFSAVNPAIETGGVLGESKINILNRIAPEFLPKTTFVKKGSNFPTILNLFEQAKLAYPIIAKPNVGERGLLVTKILDEKALEEYWKSNQIDFLMQEFVDLPLELAVMHHRFPNSKKGKVTSICIKESLKVTGDGQSTIRTLMATYPRARFQLERFEKKHPQLLTQIPQKGQVIELEPIGNHCRGTMFLNGNQHIDNQLTEIFNRVSETMEGIFYGRFDMKCASIEAVKQGALKVLEYNGVAAEPAHIYDPSYPFLKKYRDIYQHWKIIYRIFKMQQKNGITSMTLNEMIKSVRQYRIYMKSLNT